MTTINLRDGLEALYYFGEKDFDAQRNQLQDHSGYGRHATANGGPTVGVNGPNDFEAASFDGSDDFFSVPFPDFGGKETIWSFSVLAKYPSGYDPNSVSGGLFQIGTRAAALGNDGYANFKFVIRDNSNTTQYISSGFPNEIIGEYAWFTVVLKGVDVFIYVNTDLYATDTINTPVWEIPGNNVAGGGSLGYASRLTGGEQYFPGDIVAFAAFSRPISKTEINQLNRLTAPLRAQL